MTPSALRRKTERTQTTRKVRGVTFEKTACGWAAQGLRLEQIEDSYTYWTTELPNGGGPVDGKTLVALVETLIAGGHLKKDGES